MEPIRSEYKIRNVQTGLFSTGGTSPRWNKRGKTWRSMAAVSQHLALCSYSRSCGDVEVVCYELHVNPEKTVPLTQVYGDYAARKAQRAAQRDKATKKARLEHYRKEAERLERELKFA